MGKFTSYLALNLNLVFFQKFEDSSLKERRVDQTRVDAEGLVEELLASTDLKPVEQEECK